jgi:serine kinase of HPr protein (carbohydrate metabolism regulator)
VHLAPNLTDRNGLLSNKATPGALEGTTVHRGKMSKYGVMVMGPAGAGKVRRALRRLGCSPCINTARLILNG